MAEDALIRELSAAVERNPDALELRLHLAELLLAADRQAEALSHCSAALTQDPTNAAALTLLQRCSAALSAPAAEKPTFDWSAAEEQVGDIIEPAFVDYGGEPDVENERDFRQGGVRRDRRELLPDRHLRCALPLAGRQRAGGARDLRGGPAKRALRVVLRRG